MAHFAQIEDGTITQVIVVSNDDCGGLEFPESEPVGQEFIASVGIEGEWLQTSYNHNFRGRYAGIGYSYDSERDMFIEPQPFPSWTTDENGVWKPPVDMPSDGKIYVWDENSQQWIETNTLS